MFVDDELSCLFGDALRLLEVPDLLSFKAPTTYALCWAILSSQLLSEHILSKFQHRICQVIERYLPVSPPEIVEDEEFVIDVLQVCQSIISS